MDTVSAQQMLGRVTTKLMTLSSKAVAPSSATYQKYLGRFLKTESCPRPPWRFDSLGQVGSPDCTFNECPQGSPGYSPGCQTLHRAPARQGRHAAARTMAPAQRSSPGEAARTGHRMYMGKSLGSGTHTWLRILPQALSSYMVKSKALGLFVPAQCNRVGKFSFPGHLLVVK